MPKHRQNFKKKTDIEMDNFFMVFYLAFTSCMCVFCPLITIDMIRSATMYGLHNRCLLRIVIGFQVQLSCVSDGGDDVNDEDEEEGDVDDDIDEHKDSPRTGAKRTAQDVTKPVN